MLNLILLVAMYPMMMIVCYVMYNCAKPQNGMVYGSKVSAAYFQHESIKQIEAQFKAEMKRNIIIIAILPFAAFLTPYVSIQLTIWMVWTLLMLALVQIPFVRANARVKEVKRENGWYRETKQDNYVEMKAAGEVRRVKTKTFMLPTIISFLTAAGVYVLTFLGNGLIKDADYIKGFGIVILIFAFMNLLFFWTARWMDGQKTEVISTKSDVNLNYARAKKNVWKNFWLVSSWLTTVYVLICAICLIFQYRFGMAVLVGSIVYTILLLGLLFPVVKQFQKIEEIYKNERDIEIDMDDDKYWLWGTLYYNPTDRHTMVNKRVGIGTTINAATPLGKGLLIFSGLALLYIPLVCVWVIFEEFTPISLSVKENILKAEHLKIEYEIPKTEISEISCMEELPKMSKSVGTAMDNLRKGTFYISEEGNCKVFLNPQNELFLRVETEEMIYYLGGRTDEETKAVFEALQQ